MGRYPDGSTPPKGKRAFGAGQMQIGTAREAAKRAEYLGTRNDS